MFFDLLGLVLAVYTAYAAWRGEVIAKSGPFARRIARSERPRYFWVVIGIYAALAVALVLLFQPYAAEPFDCAADEATFGRCRTRELVLGYMNALAAGDIDSVLAA